MEELPSFVSHLECSYTGKIYPADQLHGLPEAGKPLLVRYDLDALGNAKVKKISLLGSLSSGATVNFCQSENPRTSYA